MDQYEIRVSQLRRLKVSIFVRGIFLSLLVLGIEFLLYFIIKNTDISFIELDHIKYTFLYKFLYILCSLISFVLILFISLHVGNKKYKKFFLECIYSECKLEEIYLLENKVTNNKLINSFLEKVLFCKNVKFISSYSDASSKFSCNINLVKYKRKKSNYGTLFSLHYDQEKPGFVQITHNDKCALDTYDGNEIIQYGMPYTSNLRNFKVYSTYGRLTYLLEDNVNGKKILALEKFLNSKIDLIFDNENLYVFAPDIRLELADNMFKSINNARFSDKVECIITLHKLLFSLIKLFDELFIINN